jgi:hypothetical protein
MPAAVLFAAALLLLAPAAEKQLTIEHPSIHQFEDGPDLASDFKFASGETLFFDFQIAGYSRTGDDKISLSWNAEIRDPAGVAVVPRQFGKVMEQLAPEDKNWLPKARLEIPIPPHAPSGVYKISLLVTDDLGKKSATREYTFQVHGHDLQPADSLQIRNITFHRSEEESKPLPVAAYARGDAVWIRFEIVGFKLGDQNRYDVDYGIEVLRANGETMFKQAEAAGDRGETFYPKRYVPAGLSLSLQKDIKPGQYTVVITARDRIGDQKAEARQTFSVE